MNNQVNWGLKPQDFEILRLLVAGKGKKEIAHHLHISSSWLTQKLTNIYRKTQTQGMVGAAVWAVRHLEKPETPCPKP